MLECLKDKKKLKILEKLLIQVRAAQIEFNEDIKNDFSTKGSLDRLEDTRADLYEWIEKNIRESETNEKR